MKHYLFLILILLVWPLSTQSMQHSTYASVQKEAVTKKPGTANSFEVKIGTLSAVRFQDMVRISWDMLQESGNLGFEIERRSEKHANWETVGFISAVKKRKKRMYEFTDFSVFEKITYYRIKQVSVDGRSSFSKSLIVPPENYAAGFSVVTPGGNNPGKLLSITLPTEQEITVRLLDVYGKEAGVLVRNTVLPAGHHLLPFTAHQYSEGVYLLLLESAEGRSTAVYLK